MDKITLHQKLQTLVKYPTLNSRTVNQFGEILEQLDDWALVHLNPLGFAEQYEFQPTEMVDVFVHAAKVGLLDFTFRTICTCCTATEYRFTGLHDIPEEHFYCHLCDKPVEATLDDHIEVVFSLNPAVKKVVIDPYINLETYLNYFSSPNLELSSQYQDFVAANRCTEFLLAPGETHTVTFKALPHREYRLTSLGAHSLVNIRTHDITSIAPQVFPLNLEPSGFPTNSIYAAAGSISLTITNHTPTSAGLGLYLTDKAKHGELNILYPPTVRPYLTAKRLLSNQSFRTLFRVQLDSHNLRLNIRSLTILFTDLKGSTQLYDQLGDAQAYSLVQEHFEILTQAVQQEGGALIKTIGDAIMATFATPIEGINAAIAMMDGMAQFNQRLPLDRSLGLKVGLHTGSTLVVTLDERLDYFGQNVNIAARVQGLGQSGEIWITDAVYESHAIPRLLHDRGYTATQYLVMLKGVEQPTSVYQCQRDRQFR